MKQKMRMKVNSMLFMQNGRPWKGAKCKITMLEKQWRNIVERIMTIGETLVKQIAK